MAIILTEGFDLATVPADLLGKGFSHAEGVIATTASKWSTPVLDIGNTSNNVLNFLGGDNSTDEYVCLSFWRYHSALPTVATGCFGGFWEAASSGSLTVGSIHVALQYTASSGDLALYRANGTFIEFVSAVIKVAVWQHFELRCRLHDTLGTIEFWVDGFKVVDLTSLDTADTGTNTHITFSGTTSVDDNYIDDVVLQQGTSIQPILASHRIHTLLPDGNGTNTAWTGTVTDVDDPFGASDGDSTFANSSTLNAQQDYSIGDLSQSPSTVHSVTLIAEVRKTDAGTIGVTPYLLSNSVEGTGTEVGTSEAFELGIDIFELDPDGAAAWDEASVNALLIGHEITTT